MKIEKTPHIFLIGFMGVGKSTISAYLSKQIKKKEIDTDAWIAAEQKMTIPQLFEEKGEAYFRNCETELLKHLKEEKEGLLVSCGGGMAMREENVALMKESGIVVLLTAKPETIFERVRYSKNRPILNGNMNVEFIAELMEKRREKYEAAADITVKADRRTSKEICADIMEQIKEL
ncbi:MAG: shikimate kinase [Clostridiales bacterium]|nr:shikimate kinase [Clostridiales bacterium]